MKLIVTMMALLLATPAFAQPTTNQPSDESKTPSNPSGSGTSTSGGVDHNNDQGRDKMGTTGRATVAPPVSDEPAQKNVTGQQKSGTNAEGRAKP